MISETEDAPKTLPARYSISQSFHKCPLSGQHRVQGVCFFLQKSLYGLAKIAKS